MFQWGQCCECAATKENKEQIDFKAVTDEGIDPQELPNLLGHSKTASFRKTAAVQDVENKKEEEGASASTRSPPQSARTESSMNEEERSAEKARLQAMVKSFSREATVGLKCKMVPTSTSGGTAAFHEYIRAKLFMDKALTTMTVQGGGKHVLIPLIDVAEACTYEDLMQHVPDSQLGTNLKEEDRSSAIFIQHQAPGLSESWVCLVVADEAEQERFVTCIRILQMYSQANAKAQSPARR